MKWVFYFTSKSLQSRGDNTVRQGRCKMYMKIYMQSIEIYGTIITTIFGGVKEAFRGNL